MRIVVKQAFAIAGKVYRPGLYTIDERLSDDLAQLEKDGWIAIVLLDDDEPAPLHKPESGLQLLRR